MTEPPPVSWLMIEKGWSVVASDGSDIGKVDEVVGDSNADIFDGLTVRTGALGKPRYVPAEQVSKIVEGRVELRLAPAAVERLGEYDQPPRSEEILPEGASRSDRIAETIRRVLRRR